MHSFNLSWIYGDHTVTLSPGCRGFLWLLVFTGVASLLLIIIFPGHIIYYYYYIAGMRGMSINSKNFGNAQTAPCDPDCHNGRFCRGPLALFARSRYRTHLELLLPWGGHFGQICLGGAYVPNNSHILSVSSLRAGYELITLKAFLAPLSLTSLGIMARLINNHVSRT